MAEISGHNDVIQPCQCRAARGLLDWTQDHLAHAAGVSRSTIRDFESGRHALQRSTAKLIETALDEAGVVLLNAEAEGFGVRLAAAR
ncbi:helix-turn-helix transcriptional regulator [Phenylobacterium sp. Root700]|uniref:helix-turn-helix domain-containing protein n=1 Tax=Phenylobacterium sp. Root700 TaxID=1736591 RepID=UPI0007002AC7|nr:helix-turn-helix transcriptional regulator [Phenylobacterium sp. Root700]KRB44710.1 transcriptional regulator [Phenylobacterium sp. Root700]